MTLVVRRRRRGVLVLPDHRSAVCTDGRRVTRTKRGDRVNPPEVTVDNVDIGERHVPRIGHGVRPNDVESDGDFRSRHRVCVLTVCRLLEVDGRSRHRRRRGIASRDDVIIQVKSGDARFVDEFRRVAFLHNARSGVRPDFFRFQIPVPVIATQVDKRNAQRVGHIRDEDRRPVARDRVRHGHGVINRVSDDCRGRIAGLLNHDHRIVVHRGGGGIAVVPLHGVEHFVLDARLVHEETFDGWQYSGRNLDSDFARIDHVAEIQRPGPDSRFPAKNLIGRIHQTVGQDVDQDNGNRLIHRTVVRYNHRIGDLGSGGHHRYRRLLDREIHRADSNRGIRDGRHVRSGGRRSRHVRDVLDVVRAVDRTDVSILPVDHVVLLVDPGFGRIELGVSVGIAGRRTGDRSQQVIDQDERMQRYVAGVRHGIRIGNRLPDLSGGMARYLDDGDRRIGR